MKPFVYCCPTLMINSQKCIRREFKDNFSSDFNFCSDEAVWSTVPGMAMIDNLPNELLVEVFGYLSIHELLRVSSCCKHWLQLSCDQQLWRSMTFTCHDDVDVCSDDLNERGDRNVPMIYRHLDSIQKTRQQLQNKFSCKDVWFRSRSQLIIFTINFGLPSTRFLASFAGKGSRVSLIRSLNLEESNDVVTDDFLSLLFDVLRSLDSIELSSCAKLTDAGFDGLFRGKRPAASQLKRLRIRKCFGLSDQLLASLARHCKVLEYLDIGENGPRMVDLCRLLVVENGEGEGGRRDILNSLISLNISSMHYLQPEMLEKFLRLLTPPSTTTSNLQHLDLSYLFNLTPAVLENLFFTESAKHGNSFGQRELEPNVECLTRAKHQGKFSIQSTEGSLISTLSAAPVGNKKFVLDVRNCDQLTLSDLNSTLQRFNSHLLLARDIINSTHILHNCKLFDHSAASISTYLSLLVGK